MKVDILAIGAHPDDIELGCGGTLIRQVKAGQVVGLLDLTQGETGTRGTAAIRAAEAREAAAILGATHRENLGLPDGFLSADKEQKLALVAAIRFFRPDVVLGNAEDDRHPDHGNAARLIEEACFLSGLAKIDTQRDGVKQEAWRPRLVLHYIQDRYLKPDVVIDISSEMDDKLRAIQAHKSQFYDPNSAEPDTYIASKLFFDNISARAMELGRACGFTYGEGYTCRRFLGTQNLMSLV